MNALSLPTALARLFLDTLAPRRCLCCRTFDTWLCEACMHTLITHDTHNICHACTKTPTPYGNLCTHCRGTSPLDSVFVATDAPHKEKRVLTRVIHYYKYHFVRELAAPLGMIAAAHVQRAALPLPDIIIPVPLHTRRLHWRSFNQSTLLAQEIAPHLAHGLTTPVATNILLRTRHTPPQVRTKDRTARCANLRGAFAVADTAPVRGKTVLLIDDVTTSGATLVECANVLKDAGARTVHALTLCRGT